MMKRPTLHPVRAAVPVLSALAFAAIGASALAGIDPVSDAAAQAIAKEILVDYVKERGKNVPRWSTLAYDDGSGSPVDCPTTKTSGIKPVTFKDCNLAYFELQQERWDDVLQSWAVLTPEQKTKLAPQIATLFADMEEITATSMGSQAVKKGYQGAGGLMGMLAALGITVDQSTEATVKAMLDGSFLKDAPEALTSLVKFNSSGDLPDIQATIDAASGLFKGSDGKGFDTSRLTNAIQLNRQETIVEKGKLEATTSVAANSKTRAEAVKEITKKIQELGKSPADASLVSAQLAQYEFYLSALDALGREEQIKAGLQKQGEAAEERLKAVSMQASRTERNLKRALGK
jgi:hypothetical protein